MKKIVFPCTNRVHLARQQLLLEELREHFDVDVFKPTTKQEGGMSVFAILCAIEFNNFLNGKNYDAVLIRGDRFEMLGLAMMASYRGIKLAHLEAGDLSGVIDNKVRHAITHLSDFHFPTNEESHSRLISMGVSPRKVWNFGSLDVEFAASTPPKKLREKHYIVTAYHPVPDESMHEVAEAMHNFKNLGTHEVVNIVSNSDYGKSYGEENYGPEDYINLLRFADCCVGNSSSFLKEASILGTAVVNVGARQEKRLKPRNVVSVLCHKDAILRAIQFQIGNKYDSDFTYFNGVTSHSIANQLAKLI
jgi:UDP-hydrolysing UDP-N-acetyl-D-glucosamine 2-epimerase